MTASPCPDAARLLAFTSGGLSEQSLETVSQHLDQCTTCETAVAALENTSDSLIERIRRPADEPAVLQEPEFEHAVALAMAVGDDPSFASGGGAKAEETLPERIGQYQILAKLGQGGMGAVYKALHTQLEKVVALKALPAERMQDAAAVERFRREMKAVGKLSHPNIVTATDAGEADGMHYLVMELVEGLDLAKLVRRHGSLPLADACELVRQAAQGLQHAHEQGLVHRDIKPSNLMLTPAGEIKILDFGLARLHEPGAEESDLTSTGQLMGTAEFMAPEQGGDSHDVDIRADIYSLGATLYMLLSGQPPFAGEKHRTVMQKLTALATQPVPPLVNFRPDAPAELIEVLNRMLAKSPKNRYAAPAEVADALRPLAEGCALPSLIASAMSDGPATTVAESGPSSSTQDYLSSAYTGTDPRLYADREEGVEVGIRSAERGMEPEDRVAAPRRLRASRRFSRRTALAAVLLVGAAVLGGVFLTLRTPYGVVEIELGEGLSAEEIKAIKIEITGRGAVQVADAKNGWTIKLDEGRYDLKLQGGQDRFEVSQHQVRVRRDDRIRVTVTLKPLAKANGKRQPAGLHPWKPTPEQQHFFDAVAKLKPEQQIEAVRARLKLVNPDFEGKLEYQVEGGAVTQLALNSPAAGDLWPVAALRGLRRLDCSGTGVERLGPIGRLRELVSLDCSDTPLRDLAPVAKLTRLGYLDCSNTSVFDLTPLDGLPLTVLKSPALTAYNERAVAVVNSLQRLKTFNSLAPADWLDRRRQVEELRATAVAFTAQKQLERIVALLKAFNPGFDGKLQHKIENGRVVDLRFITDQVTDISPFRALPDLERLDCFGSAPGKCRLADLSPLQGLPLTELRCYYTRVADRQPCKRSLRKCNTRFVLRHFGRLCLTLF